MLLHIALGKLDRMHSVGVFCGSSHGHDPAFIEAARELGALIARRGLRLVYGGGKVGLMGELADAALAAGGVVVGVIPQMLLDREVGHEGLTELEVVASMSQRKERMAELGDVFIALPGGIGTLDELFEVWTLSQLEQHNKPCALLNINGFFDPLLAFLDRAVDIGFLRPRHRALLTVASDPQTLLAGWGLMGTEGLALPNSIQIQ